MPLGQRIKRLPGNKLLRHLPLEFDAVRTLSGHGFLPSKAQHTLSIHSLQPVRLQGRTPLFALQMSAFDPKRTSDNGTIPSNHLIGPGTVAQAFEALQKGCVPSLLVAFGDSG